ncbi:MAG: hypothetical protein Q8N51_14830 [Gammaproteobacteria bacterium]|nr:hypothetical protein [Gammaproteobacteria bacterium]
MLATLLALTAAATASDLTSCISITDDQQRLACYDRLAERAAPVITSPEALFGLEPTATTRLLQQRLGDEPIDVLDQQVIAISRDPFNKLQISLDNGQQWLQIDSGRLRLKVGDIIRIRRASLGSYLLYLQTGGRSLRVRRIDAGPHPDAQL